MAQSTLGLKILGLPNGHLSTMFHFSKSLNDSYTSIIGRSRLSPIVLYVIPNLLKKTT